MADNMSLYTAPDVFLESTSPMTLSDLSVDIGLRKAFCLKQTVADKLLSDVADVAQKAVAGDLVRKGAKKEVRYVVDIGEELKNAIDSGAVKLDCNKAGEVFAQIRDSSGHFGVKLPIKKELIAAGIDPTAVAQALQMKAIENKLNLMLDALDEIGQDVSAVIQGQQNDRIGLYNSGLNLYIESTNIQDQTLRTLVSAQAIKSLSDGTEQLLQEVQSHIHYLLENQHTKKKGHSIEDIYDKMNQINKCFGVIHKSYLLKASIYYAHNEIPAKVNDVRAMAAEVQDEFNAECDPAQGKSGSRALIKLRAELVRLYARQQELDGNAESDAEKAMTAELLDVLEKINKAAAEAVNFTYTPLNELAALQ